MQNVTLKYLIQKGTIQKSNSLQQTTQHKKHTDSITATQGKDYLYTQGNQGSGHSWGNETFSQKFELIS